MMIYTNFVELESLMLHAKFQIMFLEKKILKVFTIYGRGSHLGHVTMDHSYNL